MRGHGTLMWMCGAVVVGALIVVPVTASASPFLPVLALMAAVFIFSGLVAGPALADSGGGSTMPTTNSVPSAPPGVSPAEPAAHHR